SRPQATSKFVPARLEETNTPDADSEYQFNPYDQWEIPVKSFRCILTCLLTLVLVAGCASTTVTSQTSMVDQGLPRPNRFWVYTFTAAPAETPADSSIRNAVSGSATPPTAGQIAQGRQLGAL